MTCFAFLAQRFVDYHHGIGSDRLGEVAFFAGHFFMRALQFEPAVAIVHEQQLRPVCGLMALFTTRHNFLAKLPAMDVVMAFNTAKPQRAIPHERGR